MICTPPELAPEKPEYVTIDFVKGEPVGVNGKKMDPVALVEELNKIGARNGVGISDIVENRLVGMKSRGVYETPAGTILYLAHTMIESLTLDRATLHYKEQVAVRFAELVYDGCWYTPLREALSKFVDETQKTVTGTARVKLYKGSAVDAGVKSEYSLYDEATATFGKDEVYNQMDSAGFINLFGLPLKIRALKLKDKDIK